MQKQRLVLLQHLLCMNWWIMLALSQPWQNMAQRQLQCVVLVVRPSSPCASDCVGFVGAVWAGRKEPVSHVSKDFTVFWLCDWGFGESHWSPTCLFVVTEKETCMTLGRVQIYQAFEQTDHSWHVHRYMGMVNTEGRGSSCACGLVWWNHLKASYNLFLFFKAEIWFNVGKFSLKA